MTGLLDLLIIVTLLVGIGLGYRRGFILQAIHLVGFIVAFIVAYRYSSQLAPALPAWIPYPFLDKEVGQSIWLQVLDMEGMYYAAVAFALLFFGTKLALYVLGHLLNIIALLPGLNLANRGLGGILGFLEACIIIFVLVHVLLFVPWSTGQSLLASSQLSQWMFEQTPFFTEQLQELWNEKGGSI